jgi:hypothetical protein
MLEQPEKMALDIPDAKLPTEHLIEMIKRAQAGERFYESRIYDGSDNGDSAMITTSILGALASAQGQRHRSKGCGRACR